MPASIGETGLFVNPCPPPAVLRIVEKRRRKTDIFSRRQPGGIASVYTSKATAPDPGARMARMNSSTLERCRPRSGPVRCQFCDETRLDNVHPATAGNGPE